MDFVFDSFELSTVVAVAVVILLILLVMVLGYIKSPPDKAIIISGFRKPRVLIGQAGIRIPFLERVDVLIVKQISVDIKTNGYIPTNDYIGVDIDAIAKVRIKTDKDGIALAQRNFLNMKEGQIVTALTDSLQGNMREIIGTVKLQDLCTNRKAFGDQVQEKAQNDMAALGIEIISCNIQKIKDEKDLILALGQDNMSQIQKSSSIAKAQAERDVQIADASAKKEANAARVAAETEIAQRLTDLEIKKAELKVQTDTAKAEADAAYEIQKQQQEKKIQTETINAQIARAERESELKEREISIKQRQLEAEVNKQADAEKYATEQRATADLIKRQREAEATRYAAEQEAAGIRAKYEAEANGIALKGKAEAEAAKARGLAEAEAMEKKAEAYNKYNRAAMVEMIIKVLPEIAGKVAEPLKQIDKITIVGGGSDNSGLSNVADNVPLMMKKTFESVKEVTGIDLTEIVRAESYDAKVNKNVNISGLSDILSNVQVKNVTEKPEDQNAKKTVVSDKDTKEVVSPNQDIKEVTSSAHNAKKVVKTDQNTKEITYKEDLIDNTKDNKDKDE